MSRPLRVEFENAWYHVMNRGAGGRIIFQNRYHREKFLALLSDIHRRFRVEIHGFCLMGNHYHLLIRTPLANLSRAMRHLNSVYTMAYNKTMSTDGALFRGRFKSIIIDSDGYLQNLSRYIHLNPVVAGLCDEPDSYKWSSYRYYVDGKDIPDWLYVDEILNWFGEIEQVNKYKKFVGEGIDKQTENLFSSFQGSSIFGSEAFSRKIASKYLKSRFPDKEIPELIRVKKIRSICITTILETVANFYGVSVQHLKESKRGEFNVPRSIAIYLSIELTQMSLKEIAKYMGDISYSGISHSYAQTNEFIANSLDLVKELVELCEIFKS